MSDWKDISTAPKDGTWILLYVPPHDEHPIGHQYVAVYEPINYGAAAWAFGPMAHDHSTRYGVHYEPTHWMELPDDPA